MLPKQRRRWHCETSDARSNELDIVQYYIKSPPCFYLTLLVAARNIPLEGNKYMMDNITTQAENILARDCPNAAEYDRELFEGPGIITLGQPLVVKISANVPFEYVIGRSQQNLEAVPAAARRWFSRKHCSIQAYLGKKGRAGQVLFALRDLNSANGTFLNGRALPCGGSAPLVNNDVIGVSMTDNGGLMLGFRFSVVTLSEQRWYHDRFHELPYTVPVNPRPEGELQTAETEAEEEAVPNASSD